MSGHAVSGIGICEDGSQRWNELMLLHQLLGITQQFGLKMLTELAAVNRERDVAALRDEERELLVFRQHERAVEQHVGRDRGEARHVG